MTDPDAATRLLEALRGLDLTSADGRAGLGTLLAEIERAAPDAILQKAAGIDLRRMGWRGAPRCAQAASDRVASASARPECG